MQTYAIPAFKQILYFTWHLPDRFGLRLKTIKPGEKKYPGKEKSRKWKSIEKSFSLVFTWFSKPIRTKKKK